MATVIRETKIQPQTIVTGPPFVNARLRAIEIGNDEVSAGKEHDRIGLTCAGSKWYRHDCATETQHRNHTHRPPKLLVIPHFLQPRIWVIHRLAFHGAPRGYHLRRRKALLARALGEGGHIGFVSKVGNVNLGYTAVMG